jgi:ketosteroid isomerase-like protein
MIVLSVFGFCILAGATSAQAQRQAAPTAAKPAGAMSDHAAVEAALKANEQKIDDAFTKKDVATFQSFVAPDAFAIDPTGGNTASEMIKQFPSMDYKVTNVKLSNHTFHWVDDNTVIMAYTWTGQGTAMGQPVPSPVYASTVWTKKNGKWVAVFHQETPAMPMPKK